LKPRRVEVTTRGGPYAGVSSAVVARRADKMLAHLAGPGVRVELGVALVDDATIRDLNRTWRRKDKPTDVLAFPIVQPPGPCAPEGQLGDVIISVPTARRQARAHRRPLLDEVTMLLAHGLLHLCGFDHRTDAEERHMDEHTGVLCAVAARRSARPAGG
jgi:probable rRNA maturation factor